MDQFLTSSSKGLAKRTQRCWYHGGIVDDDDDNDCDKDDDGGGDGDGDDTDAVLLFAPPPRPALINTQDCHAYPAAILVIMMIFLIMMIILMMDLVCFLQLILLDLRMFHTQFSFAL